MKLKTLKKLNRLCEQEFNARLQRKENLLDLTELAEKIGDNLKTINLREERMATVRRGIEINQTELEKLQVKLAKYKKPEPMLTDEEIENAPSVEKKSLDWQSVSTKQKEFKKAYLQGNLKVAMELFETLKIFYRAYAGSRAA